MARRDLIKELVRLFGLPPEAEELVRRRLEASSTPPHASQPPDEPGPAPRRRTRRSRPETADTPPAPSRIEWVQPPAPAPKPKARSSRRQSEIEWGGGANAAPDPAGLIGLEDAFDHTPLQPGEKVAFCTRDRVAYHLTTWQFLKSQNHGRCCICGQSNVFEILTLPGVSPAEGGLPKPLRPLPVISREYADQVITLQEVPNYVNFAVTLQDYAYEVYKTRNTGTYFVRFEPREAGQAVYEGFKVVIFPRYESEWTNLGLSPMDYQGHTIRVRGVIQVHPEWGIEILVHHPRLIEIVEGPKGAAPPAAQPPLEGA